MKASKMFFTTAVSAVLLSMLLLGSICSAQEPSATAVPNLIRYTGTVKDAQGAMPSGTPVAVTFTIYAQQDSAEALWQEIQQVTPDASGQFSVILGSTTATGLPDDLFAQQEQRWLGVQVQGQAEQARVLLVSVPYALKAQEAETLGGLPASAFVQVAPSGASSSGTANAGGAANVTSAGSAGSTTTGRSPTAKDKEPLGPCVVTPGYITYWDNTGALCALEPLSAREWGL